LIWLPSILMASSPSAAELVEAEFEQVLETYFAVNEPDESDAELTDTNVDDTSSFRDEDYDEAERLGFEVSYFYFYFFFQKTTKTIAEYSKSSFHRKKVTEEELVPQLKILTMFPVVWEPKPSTLTLPTLNSQELIQCNRNCKCNGATVLH